MAVGAGKRHFAVGVANLGRRPEHSRTVRLQHLPSRV